MPGILAKSGWSDFKIDENGALDPERKTLSGDLDEMIGKVVKEVTDIYFKAYRTTEALAAVWCLIARPESHPVL